MNLKTLNTRGNLDELFTGFVKRKHSGRFKTEKCSCCTVEGLREKKFSFLLEGIWYREKVFSERNFLLDKIPSS